MSGNDVFLYSGEAIPADVRLRDPNGVAGPIDHPATIVVTLDDVTVTSSGAVGHSGTISATLSDIAVTSSGTVGHPCSISATLGDVTAEINGATGHPGTVSVTLGDVTVSISGTIGHPGSVSVVLEDVAASINGFSGHVASLDAVLDGITVELFATVSRGTVTQPTGGYHAAFAKGRVRTSEDIRKAREKWGIIPKKVEKIISKVADESEDVDEALRLFLETMEREAIATRKAYEGLLREYMRIQREREDDEEDVLALLLS